MYILSKQLIVALNNNSITYCHWKSNINLDKALMGYDDLDLLVHPNDSVKFENIISKLSFIEASDNVIKYPGVKHFYGLDANTGNILHLHVYYNLITGDSWTKGLHLNILDYIFKNLEVHPSGMPIPIKHVELGIYLARVIMKYASLLENILLMNDSAAIKAELDFLSKGADIVELNNLYKILFRENYEKMVESFISAIQSDRKMGPWILGRKLRRRMKYHRRYSSCYSFLLSVHHLVYRSSRKLFYANHKKTIHSKSVFIAITGLDATGKTTVTTELREWLKKNFTAHLIHVGKPPSHFVTMPANSLIKIFRHKNYNKNFNYSLKVESSKRSFLFVLRQLILAYDRYKLVKKYFKKAQNGHLLICDRYPSQGIGVMDSRRLNPSQEKGFRKSIARIENHLYNNFPSPDLLFHLTVPLDIAVRRNEQRIKKGKESEKFIRQRYKDNAILDYKANTFLKVDTNQDYNKQIREMKLAIWDTFRSS